MKRQRPRVYVTRRLPEGALDVFEGTCEVSQWPHEKEPVPPEVLRSEAAQSDGLYVLLSDKVDRTLIEASPRLKVVSNMAVGYDNIDVESCTERGIVVTNTPGVLTGTTADLTWALLMATARRFQEARRVLDAGEWRSWYPMLLTGQDVYGATLGIVGAGRIGQAVARRAKGFNMPILYHNRRPAPEFERETGAAYVSLEELLERSDFVTVLVPLTPQTRGMFGAEQFRRMKPTAVFINTSRGAVVDENALYEALVEQRIWAAGLDVFEKEPIAADHPLLSLPNCTALPHIGSASIRTRTRMAHMAAEDLLATLTGGRPRHPVNPQVLEG